MRKLKLQMHITLDGFAGKENGEMDWMTVDWSKDLHKFTIENLDDTDYIIIALGKKMDVSFFSYWGATAGKPEDPFFEVAKKIMTTPKIIISKYPVDAQFPNTRIIKGDVISQVNQLKKQDGNDIMVYGGVTLASSLIKSDLVDEFYFLLNPVVIGKGLSIFEGINGNLTLELVTSEPDKCGIVVNKYIKKTK